MTYTYQPSTKNLTAEEAVRALQMQYPGRTQLGPVNCDEGIDRVEEELTALGIEVAPLRVDPRRYQAYVARAEYRQRYPTYYVDNFHEKSLEHFIVGELS